MHDLPELDLAMIAGSSCILKYRQLGEQGGKTEKQNQPRSRFRY